MIPGPPPPLLSLPCSIAIIVITIGLQIFIVEVGGRFTSTTGLELKEWGWSVLMGFGSVPVGIVMRFIPVKEDPKSFATFYSNEESGGGDASPRVSSASGEGTGSARASRSGTAATARVIEVASV